MYSLKWSGDGESLLFSGVASDTGWASYIVSTRGGAARAVAPQYATFSAAGDSLLWTDGFAPGRDHWVKLGNLDGVIHDSIHVAGPADYFEVEAAIPASRWIVVRVAPPNVATDELRAFDRNGRVGGSFIVRNLAAGYVMASSDALWIEVSSGPSPLEAILRVPFDTATGRFGSHADTMYIGDRGGTPTLYSVTRDGGTLLLNEAKTEYGAWAVSLHDAFRGALPIEKRLMRSAGTPISLRVSPDGGRLLLAAISTSPRGASPRLLGRQKRNSPSLRRRRTCGGPIQQL